MDRDEFERIKAEEKAHLRKVRALKQDLREAKRKRGLLDALRGLDTSALDAEHEEALRKVAEQNVTAEARFELAMDALDEAEKQEAARQEMARIEADRQRTDAADLVRQMKADMLGDVDRTASQPERTTSQGSPPANDAPDEAAPGKSIGATPGASDRSEPPSDPPAPGRTIGRRRGTEGNAPSGTDRDGGRD